MKNLITVFISICALVLSFITLYFTKLKKASITIILDDSIDVCYNYFDNKEFFELHLPVAFINQGAKAGIIYRCAINLFSKKEPDRNYLIKWRNFIKFDPIEYRYADEGTAHPIILLNNTTVQKRVLFVWDTPKHKLKLKTDIYELHFYFWLTPEKNAAPEKVIITKFHVDEKIITDLEKSLAAAKKAGWNPYTSISIDGSYPKNMFLPKTPGGIPPWQEPKQGSTNA